MRNVVALVIAGAFACSSLAYAESETEKEVKQTILEGNEYTNKNLTGRPDDYSQHGALEYWSSGGLLHDIAPGGRPEPFEVFNIEVKHIKVITLVEGQAAVAHYYSEGSMKPKGSPAVNNYLTRVSQVFVKEDGKWKVRVPRTGRRSPEGRERLRRPSNYNRLGASGTGGEVLRHRCPPPGRPLAWAAVL